MNLSGEAIALVGGHSVPPHGRLVLDHDAYIQVALDNDLSALDIRVTMPDLQLRAVSARDFGAVGDGVTDASYAVQNAVDSVASLGGGVVSLPVGVYVVSTVVLHGGTSLRGDSMGGSVLKQMGGVSMPVLSVSRGSASVSDLTLLSNGEGE